MDSRCPRKLGKLPTEPCPEGRKAVDAARKGKEGGCPWFVNDAESCFCFWKYMQNEGQGRETSVAKTTRLLMVEDESEVKQIIKDKSKMLVKALE